MRGTKSQDALPSAVGRGKLSAPLVQHGELLPEHRVVGLRLNGLLQACQRLVERAMVQMHHGQVGPGPDQRRVEPQGFKIRRLRFGQPTESVQGIAQVAPQLGDVRMHPHGGFQMWKRGLRLVVLQQHTPQVNPRRRVVRIGVGGPG